MRRRNLLAPTIRTCLSLAFFVIGGNALAHHSNAIFDQENKLVLGGTVREFQWQNPHCYVQLLVQDDNGVEKEWSIEMGAIFYLQNRGWRRSTLKPGDHIRVTVAPVRDGSSSGLFFEATNADGKPLVGAVN
jgi:hypothetical protein